ncbi:MAG: TonB-dependent receptor [Bacteroidota bacterium]|nr:TonB-dependent receptor [Bacteroidota bacterium]
MKLTTFFLLITFITVNASVYSQVTKLDLKVQSVTVKEVLSRIEDQSQFFFMYNDRKIDVERKVNLDLKQAKIEDLLKTIFEGTDTKFIIKDRQIVLFNESDEGFRVSSTEAVMQQQKSASGKVTDSSGGSLPGVSVVVKGTTNGTITDSDGKYSISKIPENAVLQFSFVGMKTQEIVVGNKASINVILVDETIEIEEVVAVGYGTMKKSDLTGSLSQVKSEAINSFPTTNALQALVGKASGMQVMQNTGAPGSNVSIRIRGTNSIQGSNEPLYIVDGFPISISSIAVVNNADIESIEILKDASATAIYGSRGANGVVLITTKNGKVGKTKVEFESSYGIQSLRKKLDLMNASEYAMFYNEQAKNDNEKPYFTQSQIDALGKGTDWEDMIFQNAPMKTLGVGISGGNEKTQFVVSGNYLGQEGIVKTNDYNKYSLRTNINHQLSSKLSMNITSVLSRIINHPVSEKGGNRGSSLISSILSAPPTLTPFNSDGSYSQFILASPPSASSNPMNLINEQTTSVRSNKILTNAAIVYKPIKDITIKISGGIENSDDRNDTYVTTQFINSKGSASVSTRQFTSLLSENTISYNKTFKKKHNLNILAGFTYQDFINTTLSGSGTGFVSNASETYDLGSAITPGIPASSYTKSTLLSYLSRINYSFDNKYLATFSLRADGASKYSEGNKWGYFPSGSLAWRISNENFFKDIHFISSMKIRASWGYTGSEAINAYATLTQLSSGKTAFDNSLYTYYSPRTTLPGNLRWETTEQKDLGVDVSFLENRLSFTGDYYIKNTRDLLSTVKLPSSLGFTTTIKNIGEVKNYGFEFGLDAKVLTGSFKWDVNANMSVNRNEVIKLYGGQDILGGFVAVTAVNDNGNILREGQPIGRFWGYIEDGYTETGKIKYLDIDKDGTITSKDKTYIGDPNPKFIYGFNSSMMYKNFVLDFFIQGTEGNDIFNISAINSTIDYGNGLNMPKDVFLNHWTSSNQDAKYPIISRSTSANVSNRWIEDGSYLRLKNIKLGYNVPFHKTNGIGITNLQFYVSGQNLLTLTKYSWWDPEVNTEGGANSTSQGFDFYGYPSAKTITFGIQAGF